MGNYRLYELVIEVLDRPLEGDDGKLGMGLAVTTLPRHQQRHQQASSMLPTIHSDHYRSNQCPSLGEVVILFAGYFNINYPTTRTK